MPFRIDNPRSMEDTAIGRVMRSSARPRKEKKVVDDLEEVATSSTRYERHVISTKEMKRVEMNDFACRCHFIIKPIERPEMRCGLCGSAVIHPYRHFRLLEPTLQELVGNGYRRVERK